MEAKIIALDTATSEVEFLKNLLCDLPLLNKPIPQIPMHCDNQVDISKVTCKNFNEKRRHLRVRYKSIRNLICITKSLNNSRKTCIMNVIINGSF